MGRPKLANHLRRSKILPVRLSPGEFAKLERIAEELEISIGQLVRKSIASYVKPKSKDGHRKGKEKKER